MDKLKLSLQGYNYGNGTSHGQSGTMAVIVKPMRCSFPRNRQPPMDGQGMAIRSMYPCASILFRRGIVCRTFWKGAACDHCEKPVGERRRPEVWSWYGFDSREEWCACFVSWCADQAGLIQKEVVPKFSVLYGRCGFVSGKEKMAKVEEVFRRRKPHLF